MKNVVKIPYTFLLPLCLAICILSCSSPDSAELPLTAPGFSQPVVTGIYLTDAIGPDPIGIWGNPSEQVQSNAKNVFVSLDAAQSAEKISIQYQLASITPLVPAGAVNLDHPYPNPCNRSLTLRIALPVQGTVDLWMVPARWIDSENKDVTFSAGTLTVTPQRVAAAVFIRSQILRPGLYTISWTVPEELPMGFYRVYLKNETSLAWHDVLFYKNVSELPPGLKP